MRIVVIGGTGRLGAVVTSELGSRNHHVTALGSRQLDITHADSVEDVLSPLRPEVIVNCSAFNAVDAAQADVASAFSLNAAGPASLARVARRTGALLVHYSTDFVFDGTASDAYVEEDTPNPLNVYGASKLAGEHEVSAAPRHYVLRIESLFGGLGVKGHRATVDHIADRIEAGEVVRAAVDRTVSPTYAVDAAHATAELIAHDATPGIYHCVNDGFTTWYDLAHEVARQLRIPAHIQRMRADELPVAAPRPAFCALSNRKLAALGIRMPSWQSAIARHVAGRQTTPRRHATSIAAKSA